MSGNDKKHIADELDYQVTRIWGLLGDLPPTGGCGWGMLKFEELADVCKRASDALRIQPYRYKTPAEMLGFHTGTTGE